MIRRSSARLRRAVFGLRYRLELIRRFGRPRRDLTGVPAVAVVYVYPVVGEPEHDVSARRFASSYREFPPLYDHSLHVIFNGGPPSAESIAVFDAIEVQFHTRDNSGWDIGAFQWAARRIECDIMVCLGSNSHFKRAGWLRRMGEVFRERGDALYGASGSYECSPHIRTTAFWCNPELIRAYTKRVRTYEDRYEFEHGSSSITAHTKALGLACWVVTWDGVYGESEWRTPPNIFRRGDQSNSIVRDRYFDLYDSADEEAKAACAALADTWVDRAPARWEAWRETGV